MPQLHRNAPKLLSRVGGKAHASSEDHEDDVTERLLRADTMTDEQIIADPISSSDEREVDANTSPPLPRASQTFTSTKGTKQTTTKGKVNSRSKKIQAPRAGSHLVGQKRKMRVRVEEEKENKKVTPTSSVEARPADEGWGFGMAFSAPAKRRRVDPVVPNIHAQSGKSKVGYKGKSKAGPKTFSRHKNPSFKAGDEDSDASTKDLKGTNAVLDKLNQNRPPVREEVSDSDVSLKSVEDVDHVLDKLNSKKKTLGKNALVTHSSPAKPPRPNLLASLAAYKQPESSPPDAADNGSDPASAPASSQVLPQERDTLAHLQQHVANLPSEEDPNFECQLCQEPVDPDHQADFWKFRNRTVKNQSLFCKEHNVRTARARYAKQGFPVIDWAALPGRIENLRPQLVRLLRNETESKYREQHAAKLLSGKAAALPTRRRGQQHEDIDKNLEAFDMPAPTGYYGPRGRRVMMETATSVLRDDIHEAQTNDPIISRSGFAVYLQTVLVPELTVLLVREDFDVHEKMAGELVEQSADLGALLHEEVDDVVKAGSDEEEEKELVDMDDDEKYEALVQKVTREERDDRKSKRKEEIRQMKNGFKDDV